MAQSRYTKTLVYCADHIWDFATRLLFERGDRVHIKIRGELRFCFLHLFAPKLATLHTKPIPVGNHRTISVRGPRHTEQFYGVTIVENVDRFMSEVRNVKLHVLKLPFAFVVAQPLQSHPVSERLCIVVSLTTYVHG